MLRSILTATAAALALSSTARAQPAAPASALAAPDPKLAYVILFVSDMKGAVAFYRDKVGFKLKFASPGWSEFDTGATTLSLHPASPENPAGSSQIGVTVADLNGFYASRQSAGVAFKSPPKPQAYGAPLAEMRGPDDATLSVAGR